MAIRKKEYKIMLDALEQSHRLYLSFLVSSNQWLKAQRVILEHSHNLLEIERAYNSTEK